VINVGCWIGRIVLDCTLCDWQDPPVDATTAQQARPLAELIDLAAVHVAEQHPREPRSMYVTVPPHVLVELVPGARIMHTEADALTMSVQIGEYRPVGGEA
jgi:hypothetical protein